MCGIGGILYSKDSINTLNRKLAQINTLQKHRGPDEQFSLIMGPHGLCHQRLAMVDIARGQQPMKDASGRYVIVFNGEIYNYPDLKKKLDYPFTTDSDSEVILAAFIIWGEACLNHFDGMFAFLIWDTLTETAFAARDPLGVKPFVYTHQSGSFLFASEVKTVIAILNAKVEIDACMLAEYLIAPYFSGGGEKSILKDLHYLPPGTCMSINSDGISQRRYYCFEGNHTPVSEKKLSSFLESALEDSVLGTLKHDSEIGIFLSGGLDSSLLGAIAVQHTKKTPLAFSIAFPNHSAINFDPSTIVNSDDLPYALELVKLLQLPFHRVEAHDASPISQNLQTMARINDRIPAWEQEMTQHFLAQTASRFVKTVLVGDAADETHYGYFFLLNEKITSSPLNLLLHFGGSQRANLLAPHLQKELQPLHYLDAKYREMAKNSGHDFGKNHYENISAMSTLIRQKWLERLLHNGDIHTMQFGLEARVPFANRSLLLTASKISPQQGFKHGIEKFMLRQVASKWLPPHFCHRKKSALPRDPRLGTAYQRILRDLLKEKNDFVDAFLNRPSLVAITESKEMSENNRMILFNLICLIYWSKLYAK